MKRVLEVILGLRLLMFIAGVIVGILLSAGVIFPILDYDPKITEEQKDVLYEKIDASVKETYATHRKDKITTETMAKIDKMKTYFENNQHLKSVAESRIKIASVFLELDIPLQQYDAAWDYYQEIKNNEQTNE